MFCRYDLRTTDPDAARSFYSEVVGLEFTENRSSEESSILGIWPLHEQARARGAPPHWLGHIGVTDLEASVARLLALGGERLGPTVQTHDGTAYATLRDPSGAVIAIRAIRPSTATGTGTRAPRVSPVAWHHHHTRDLERAWGAYSEVFAWTQAGTIDVPDPEGGYRMFACDGSQAAIGSMANTARAPGVHAHWLYFFAVADLDATMAKVRARGGEIIAEPVTLPNGNGIVACHDAQGGAFGLSAPAKGGRL